MKKGIIAVIILIIIGIVGVITYFRQPKSEIRLKETILESETPGVEKEEGFGRITLISVYDNYKVNPELKTAWGFGLVIETPNERILFDTGGNSEILLFNMKKLGIDPKSIDKIVISHIHGDHLGGLEGFLKENNKVTVFIPSSFPNSIRDMIKSYGGDFVNISHSAKISDFIFSTGEHNL